MINDPVKLEQFIWLLAIGGAEDTRSLPSSWRAKWKTFGPCVSLDLDGAEENKGDYRYGFFTDVKPSDVQRRINVSTAQWDEIDGPRGDIIQLTRVRSITPEQARGRVIRMRPFMVEQSCGFLDVKKGEWSSFKFIVGTSNDFNWRGGGTTELLDAVENPHPSVASGRTELKITDGPLDSAPFLGVALGIEWTKRLWWHADISLGDAPGFRVPITAGALYDLFASRDKEPGARRLKALVHWVRSHKRKASNSDDMEHIVRQHLRGGLSFKWNDMDVTVLPSHDDLMRLHANGLAMKYPCPV